MPRKRQNAVGTKDLSIEDRKKKNKPVVLKEEHETWILETRTFPPESPPTYVDLTMGLTKNLGDFQSARMDLRIAAPCLPEEVDDYYERAKKWITIKLKKEVRKIDDSFVEG